MVETKGVVHFSLPVSDLEVSRKFYPDRNVIEISEWEGRSS